MIPLRDERACDPSLVGGKAAALARATRVGLPVLDGFVIAAVPCAGPHFDAIGAELSGAWTRLSGNGSFPLVVRSSSVIEDTESSSMAGRFRSVLGVTSWDDFRMAVQAVVDSAVGAMADGGERSAAPMGVLVQRQLHPARSGILFGADPVTGREDRVVVAVVQGGPDRLVSGEVDGSRFELDPQGRVIARRPGDGGAELPRQQRRALAGLAQRAAEEFGGPQDIEWAMDEAGRLVLLQSRPVTTELRGHPYGPVLGPGPLAETFPDPLWPLEQDLWVGPVDEALRQALSITAAGPLRRIRRFPVIVVVGGRVAVDLELVEGRPGRRLTALDPRPGFRRLRSAVRRGRLRHALPVLARQLVDRCDAELCLVPPLGRLSEAQLLAVLQRCREALVSLHGHEMLAGLLIGTEGRPVTGAGVATAVLAEARQQQRPDEELLRRSPVVLALTAPSVGPPRPLPQEVSVPPPPDDRDRPDEGALLREALRLRVRWVHELSARAAWELAGRLASAGVLPDPLEVRRLRLDALQRAVTEEVVPRLETADLRLEPLPSRFRMGTRELPIPVMEGAEAAAGAGGGCGEGVVHVGPEPPPGSVLVVGQLEPGLAPILPRLAGLVAETGSVLAHAAILAREAGVPTVVGLPDARRRFPPGTRVRVDGDAGTVTVVEEVDG